LTRKGLPALLIAALALLVAACGGGTQDAGPADDEATNGTNDDVSGEPQAGGVVTVAVTANPVSLDPALMRDWTTRQAIGHMYDTLVYIGADEEIRPRLAESWEVSEDGTVYTFHLRQGVTFHDGTPFNAEAVKFNFDRILDPEFNSSHYSTLAAMIDRVEVLDDDTVQFVLPRPNYKFLAELSMSSMIVSPTAVQQYGDDFALNPVGTGPFKFKAYEPDSHLELERYDDYWGGAPLLDGIRVRVIPERSTQLVELQAGNVDVVYTVPPKDVERLKDAGIPVETRSIATYQMLALNLAQGPTTELAVRKAIARAIDRDAIIEQVLYGYAEKSRAGVPSAAPIYNEDVPMIEYDPAEAERLLDEAGWLLGSDGVRHKDGRPLAVKLITSDDEERLLISQVVQQQLSEIGFQAELQTLEWGAFLEAMRSGDYNVAFWSLSDFSLSALDGAANMESGAFWNVSQIDKNPELAELSQRVDELIFTGRETLDVDQRREVLKEFQELTQEHQLKVWLWHNLSNTAIGPDLRDYQLYNYDYVWLDKAWLAR